MPVPRRTFKCLRQSADAPTGMEGRLDAGATSDGFRLATEAERSRVGAERQRGQPRPRFRGAQARLLQSKPMPRAKPLGTLQKPMSVVRKAHASRVSARASRLSPPNRSRREAESSPRDACAPRIRKRGGVRPVRPVRPVRQAHGRQAHGRQAHGRQAHGRRPRPTLPNPATTFSRRLLSSAACARGGLCGGTGASRWCPRLPCFRGPPARRARA